MRAFAVALVSALLFAAPLQAQDKPASDAVQAARELLAVMSPDMTKQMTAAVLNPVLQNLETQFGGRIDPETMNQLRRDIERIGDKFIADTMADAPELYARYFTAAELREMIAFYRTPTGAKALATLPKLSGELFTIMMPRMPVMQKELEAVIGAALRKAQGGR